MVQIGKLIAAAVVVLVAFSCCSYAADDKFGVNDDVVIRLNNGDLLSGIVVDKFVDSAYGAGVKLRSEIGTAVVYYTQIAEIRLRYNMNRSSHRVFVTPTAEPIGNNHFAGIFDLLFLYGGVGWEFISVTAGATLIPTIPLRDQIALVNVKFSLYQSGPASETDVVSVAAGVNHMWMNAKNSLFHLYALASYHGTRATATAGLIAKLGGPDTYEFNLGTFTSPMNVIYPSGQFGVVLSVDSRFPNMHNMHFIGELVNKNIQRPEDTIVNLGLRLHNTLFAADFGFSFFTLPAIVPFFGVVITPF